jgi:hypothetical protein
MKRLALKLKFLLKTAKSLGISLGSLKVIISLALGQEFRAVYIAKAELRRNPCNWSWLRFLLEHYRTYSDRKASVELLEVFASSSLPYLCSEPHPSSDKTQQISFNSIVEVFFLSSSDKRDFCELDFLGISDAPNLSLHIVFVGRFSNFLVQLANAISIAIAFDIKNIYVTPSLVLLDIFLDLHTFPCALFDINIHFCAPQDGFVIRGYFFHVSRQWNDFLYANHSFRNIVSLFRHATHFSQRISDHCQRRPETINKNLVIHLRSGDIFASKIVHSEYGQPPLSYYVCAIEHFAPLSVTLVYEDTLNPVIKALQDYLGFSNIPYNVQCADLRSDLNVLTNASALVMSRGTFAYGVLCFNDILSTLYCFSSSLEADPMLSLHLSRLFYGEYPSAFRPSIVEVTDKAGCYFDSICSANWYNSSSQKKLMISYPAENLSLNYFN